MNKFKREIAFAALLFVIIVGLILWFVKNETESAQKIILASVISIAGLVFFVQRLIKKKKDLSKGIPIKDEFTNMVKLYAGGKAFMLSMYYWLLIFWLNSSFSDREEMLGVGILGSALIYGICYWYYKSTGDFNNEKQN